MSGTFRPIAYTIIEAAKLDDVVPQARLTDVLSCIADHRVNRIDDPLPLPCIL